ncbi:MAG: imidazolonepropionase [Treponema sp.]|jgi:imidazolonepropionase|nr:imidazolonepropionase [Treponema sp.]
MDAANPETRAWINGKLVSMDASLGGDYGLLEGRALLTEGGLIKGFVPEGMLNPALKTRDLKGALVTPGFIDCHTHLVFAGKRAHEWEMRLNGASYEDIAAAGGGIQSTVNASRAASCEDLRSAAVKRLEAMAAEGVCTVEIKSGYGLDLETERKLLLVIQSLKEGCAMDVAATLLAAHSVPTEFAGRAAAYMDEVCGRIMPELWKEGLFEAADVFCENIAFDLSMTEKLFRTAAELGIPVKGHNEQMSNTGGTELLARYHGLSSDHLENLDERGVKALSEAGTVAVLLPTAFYFLKDTHKPPVELLRKYDVPIAVATDYNPGTSPFISLRLAMNMACTLFGLKPAEALAGVTRNAARALGRQDCCGMLKPGFRADFDVWDAEEPAELLYEPGARLLLRRVCRGREDL